MKTKIVVCLTLILFISSFSHSQNVPIWKFENLENILNKQNDTTYVINFWATWCKPCVAELPSFDTLYGHNSSSKLKIYLVSLDFVKEKTKVENYILRKKPKPTVALLDEPNYNTWIEKVEPTWSGSIPFTLILNSQKKYRKVLEKEINFHELQTIIQPIINKQ